MGLRTLGWLLVIALFSVSPQRATAAAETDDPSSLNSEFVLRALALVDVPYRYGGRTPAGFDCSGFVGYVYGQTVGVALPRRSEEIGRLGYALSRHALAAGDLVFFNTLGRPYSHVGIYLGDDRFVHAPTRRGRVRVERLSESYWVARYNGARRLMPSTAVAGTAALTSTAAATSLSGDAIEFPIGP